LSQKLAFSKKRSLPISDCVCLAQNTVLRGGASRPGGTKIFPGGQLPWPLLLAPMTDWLSKLIFLAKPLIR